MQGLELSNCPPELEAKLAPHIRAFFEKNGYALGEYYSLFLRFDLTTKPLHKEQEEATSALGGCPQGRNQGWILIYTKHTPTMAELVEAVFHELDHVLWVFEKGYPDYQHIPYAQRPNEIRAWFTGKQWRDKLDISTDKSVQEVFGINPAEAVE